jgi:hypothetical protein
MKVFEDVGKKQDVPKRCKWIIRPVTGTPLIQE